MLQKEKFNRALVFSVIFSFFLFTFSFLLAIYSQAITGVLQDTFLSSFGAINLIMLNFIFAGLRLVSGIFFAGALITLIVTFIMEWIVEEVKKS